MVEVEAVNNSVFLALTKVLYVTSLMRASVLD